MSIVVYPFMGGGINNNDFEIRLGTIRGFYFCSYIFIFPRSTLRVYGSDGTKTLNVDLGKMKIYEQK